MLSEKLYDVVCIGNYTKDTIITPSGTRYVDGGGMNYAAHAAKKLGCHVGVVTRLAREDERVVEKFRSSGIDCYPTFTPSSNLTTSQVGTSVVSLLMLCANISQLFFLKNEAKDCRNILSESVSNSVINSRFARSIS